MRWLGRGIVFAVPSRVNPSLLCLAAAALLCASACVPTAPGVAGPITAKARTWTWVEADGARCANDSPAGFGVNLGSDSKVLVYLQGGGACWDAASCFGLVPSAQNLADGYGAGKFATEPLVAGLAVLRRDGSNPFADATLVFVPYCTGDLHAGNAAQTFDHHHVSFSGRANLELFLARLAATRPDVTEAWLVGSSAGGFGTVLNVEPVQRAFPSARLGVIDDSGPPISGASGRFEAQRDAWNLAMPSGCDTCASHPEDLLSWYARQPGLRIALLSYRSDPTIEAFSGLDDETFRSSLNGLVTGMTGAQHAFIVDGSSHVVFANEALTAQGVRWLDWLQHMATDDPAWSTRSP